MKSLLLIIVHLIVMMIVVYSQDSMTPCCLACTVSGQEKFYSIDTRHNSCGECCMDPADYDLYKKYEPGLEKANSSTPCFDLNYPTYTETVTHGFGNVKMTLDLYDPESKK